MINEQFTRHFSQGNTLKYAWIPSTGVSGTPSKQTMVNLGFQTGNAWSGYPWYILCNGSNRKVKIAFYGGGSSSNTYFVFMCDTTGYFTYTYRARGDGSSVYNIDNLVAVYNGKYYQDYPSNQYAVNPSGLKRYSTLNEALAAMDDGNWDGVTPAYEMVEDLCHYDPNGIIDWERGIDTTTPKAASITMKPTRVVDDYFTTEMVLPHLKAYGATPVKHKQDKLWGRYVPCEYISFDGLPYIDLAPLTTESDIEITFRRQNGYTQTNFLFGTNPNSTTSPVVGAWYGSQGLVVQNGSQRQSGSLDTNWHTLKVTSTKTYLDGVERADAGTRTTFQNLIIGSARDERTGTVDHRCLHGDISRVKVGNKIFVACKDVVANTFGLFDIVNETFYGNAGAGTLTGGEVIQPVYGITNGTNTTIDTGILADNTKDFELHYKGTVIGDSFFILVARNTTTSDVWGLSGSKTGNTITAWGVTSNIVRVYGHIVDITATKTAAGDVTLIVKDLTAGTSHTMTGTTTYTATTNLGLFGSVASESRVGAGCICHEAWIKVDGETVWSCMPVRVGNTPYALSESGWELFSPSKGSITAGVDIPYTQLVPDIIKVNTGDLKYDWIGDNMVWFDRPDAIKLDANFTSGKVAANNDRTAMFIPVTGGKTYSFLVSDKLKTDGWYLTQFISNTIEIGTGYSIDGVSSFVNRKGYSDYTMTTDSRTKWIGISLSEGKANTPTYFNQQFMMVESATVPTYIVPKTKGIYTTGSHKLTVGGVNLFDKMAITAGKYLDSTGALVTNSKWNVSDYMPVESGQTYYQTCNTTGTAPRTCWYTADKTFISAVAQVAGGTQTAPSNAAYCRMSIWEDDLDIAMFTHGSTAPTEYSPYLPTITLDIPMLLSADSFVDTQLDSNNKSEARMVLVLNGAESWAWVADTNRLRMNVTGADGSNVLNLLCTDYEAVGTSSASITHGVNLGSGGALYLKDMTNISDLASGKAYLASKFASGNPVMLLVPLTTPAVSTHAIAPVELTEKATYTVTAESELPVTQQAVYMGLGV